MKWLLSLLAPTIINLVLDQITTDKIKEWLLLGSQEASEAAGKVFDYLATKALDTDTTLDDRVIQTARETTLTLVATLVESGGILDLLIFGAEGLVKLSDTTENDIDNALAKGVLDALRAAKV